MKTLNTLIFCGVLVLATSSIGYGNSDDATKKFKSYINKTVQKVESAETPGQKRAILNESFDTMLEAFERVESMDRIPAADKEGVAGLRRDIQEKSNELNGRDGYRRVSDSQLNKFANYVQQDLEQADKTITISITTLLLIIIIILLI